jgi:hypothetical protein
MKTKFGFPCAAMLVFLSGTAVLAQATGTAHPEDLDDDLSTAPALQHYVKPSPAVQPSVLTPVHTSARQSVAVDSSPAVSTDTRDVEELPNPGPSPRPLKIIADDDNSGVVINVPTSANELAVGTRLLSKLDMDISTKLTQTGAPFRAVLAVDTYSHGKVVLPQGTVITGRITQIHGGRRISGPSVIQLQPEDVSLPDGSHYRLHAQVSAIDRFRDSKVNAEGTIVSNSHGKATAGILGFTTGTAALTGALVGGGIGAAVGAGVAGGVGAVWWLKQDRQQTLPKGMDITFSLDAPLHLNVPVQMPAQIQSGSAGR